jgi:multidrug efflux system membrane fusion protein
LNHNAPICLAFCVLLGACGHGADPSVSGKPGAHPAVGSGPGGAAKVPMAYPVEVVPVVAREVEYLVTAVGSVQAFEEIQVTARVAGAVEDVHFAEGDTVGPEQILVEIEPRRFELAVQAAKATLRRDQAAVLDARKGLERREKMGPEVAAGEEIDTFRAKVATGEAEVAQAKAALDLANLNLHDARVRVGVAGVIQTRKVSTGQYVQPGTILATLVRRDPLLLKFAVAEEDAARLRLGQVAQFHVAGFQAPFSAKITYVAMSAEETSRLVAVQARIDHPPDTLRPGIFADVEVPVGSPVPAPVIPQTAVRPSEKGFLAFTIEGNHAKQHVLTLGMRTRDGQVEVKSGLNAGEQLVIRGAEALKEGVNVRIVANKPGPGPERKASSDLAKVPTPASPQP